MAKSARFKFRLYVADDSQNSAQALANLNAMCEQHLAGRYEIDVVDVFLEPARAMADDIRMTPTLIKLSPAPVQRIIGTLDQLERVQQILNVAPRAA
ncbi:MAG: circadian clock KaiB family protein [Steroidobacteraceae bacterium]